MAEELHHDGGDHFGEDEALAVLAGVVLLCEEADEDGELVDEILSRIDKRVGLVVVHAHEHLLHRGDHHLELFHLFVHWGQRAAVVLEGLFRLEEDAGLYAREEVVVERGCEAEKRAHSDNNLHSLNFNY